MCLKPYKNQIICADATEFLKGLPVSCIDLCVTSPPYDALRRYDGKAWLAFEQIAQGLFRCIKPGGVIVWVIGDQTKNGNESGTSFRHALYFKELGFNLFDTMIYLKPPRGAVGNNKAYWQSFEYMFVFSKGMPKTIHLLKDRANKESRHGDTGTKRLYDGELKGVKRSGYDKIGRRTNVWTYYTGNGHSSSDKIAHRHPAIFPEKLAEDHILSWSNKGDIVYDPFMGSGTTAKMCLLHERIFIGTEINPDYCAITQARLKPYLDASTRH